MMYSQTHQLVDEVTRLEDVADLRAECPNERKADTKLRMGWSAQLL
jgi:hypothetical protein